MVDWRDQLPVHRSYTNRYLLSPIRSSPFVTHEYFHATPTDRLPFVFSASATVMHRFWIYFVISTLFGQQYSRTTSEPLSFFVLIRMRKTRANQMFCFSGRHLFEQNMMKYTIFTSLDFEKLSSSNVECKFRLALLIIRDLCASC
jgi:hypothetical protein